MAGKEDLEKCDVCSVRIGQGLDFRMDIGFMPSGYFWRGAGLNRGLMNAKMIPFIDYFETG